METTGKKHRETAFGLLLNNLGKAVMEYETITKNYRDKSIDLLSDESGGIIDDTIHNVPPQESFYTNLSFLIYKFEKMNSVNRATLDHFDKII